MRAQHIRKFTPKSMITRMSMGMGMGLETTIVTTMDMRDTVTARRTNDHTHMVRTMIPIHTSTTIMTTITTTMIMTTITNTAMHLGNRKC